MTGIGKYGQRSYRAFLGLFDRLGLSHLKGSPLLIALLGLTVSLLGSLPLGVLNATALYWGTTAGMKPALQFSSAVVLVEGLWAYAALHFSGTMKIEGHRKTAMIAITTLLLGYLAFSTFQRSLQPIEVAGDLTVRAPWIMGLVLSAMNPFQVPFWLLWHHFFREQGWLTTGAGNRASYVGSIVAGSFLTLVLYAALGVYLQSRLQEVLSDFQRVLAGVFALFTLFFVFTGYRHLKQTHLSA